MSDIQPWQAPRTPPSHDEVVRTVFKSTIPPWLRAWWPAVVWAAVIFTLSTDTFSAEHTGSVLSVILHWLRQSLTREQFNFVHHLIRKSAHFTEYFIFYGFIFRGIRGDRVGWRWTWGLSAWFIAAAYSCLDEIHQAFVASRTASPYDSLLDSAGAFIAFVVLALWFQFRRRQVPTSTAPASDSQPSTP